jgi:hypothetical protein
MRNGIAGAGAVVMLLAATASSASAYPTRVEDSYRITTTAGTCDVTVVASTEPGAAAAVRTNLRGIESVHCEALSYTPYYIHLEGGFSDTSLDPLNVLYSDEPVRHCSWQKACYWSRSKGWFPPGDHYVWHEVIIDVAPYAVAETFVGYPQACRVSDGDRGHLRCYFQQWVTMPTPVAAPAP